MRVYVRVKLVTLIIIVSTILFNNLNIIEILTKINWLKNKFANRHQEKDKILDLFEI